MCQIFPKIPILCSSLELTVVSHICPCFNIIQPVLSCSTTLYSDTIYFNTLLISLFPLKACPANAIFLFHNISTTVVLSPPPFKHFCVLYRILPADPQELELTPLSNYDCYKLRNQYQALSLIKSIHLPEVVYKSGSHQA